MRNLLIFWALISKIDDILLLKPLLFYFRLFNYGDD